MANSVGKAANTKTNVNGVDIKGGDANKNLHLEPTASNRVKENSDNPTNEYSRLSVPTAGESLAAARGQLIGLLGSVEIKLKGFGQDDSTKSLLLDIDGWRTSAQLTPNSSSIQSSLIELCRLFDVEITSDIARDISALEKKIKDLDGEDRIRQLIRKYKEQRTSPSEIPTVSLSVIASTEPAVTQELAFDPGSGLSSKTPSPSLLEELASGQADIVSRVLHSSDEHPLDRSKRLKDIITAAAAVDDPEPYSKTEIAAREAAYELVRMIRSPRSQRVPSERECAMLTLSILSASLNERTIRWALRIWRQVPEEIYRDKSDFPSLFSIENGAHFLSLYDNVFYPTWLKAKARAIMEDGKRWLGRQQEERKIAELRTQLKNEAGLSASHAARRREQSLVADLLKQGTEEEIAKNQMRRVLEDGYLSFALAELDNPGVPKPPPYMMYGPTAAYFNFPWFREIIDREFGKTQAVPVQLSAFYRTFWAASPYRPDSEVLRSITPEYARILFPQIGATQLTNLCSIGCPWCGLNAEKGQPVPFSFSDQIWIAASFGTLFLRDHPWHILYYRSEPFDAEQKYWNGRLTVDYPASHRMFAAFGERPPDCLTAIPQGKEQMVLDLVKSEEDPPVVGSVSLSAMNQKRLEKKIPDLFKQEEKGRVRIELITPDTSLSWKTQSQPTKYWGGGLGCFDGPVIAPDRIFNVVQIWHTPKYIEYQISTRIDPSRLRHPLPSKPGEEVPLETVLSSGVVTWREQSEKFPLNEEIRAGTGDIIGWDLFHRKPYNVVHVKNLCSEGYYLIDAVSGTATPVTEVEYRLCGPAMQQLLWRDPMEVYPWDDLPFLAQLNLEKLDLPWLNKRLVQRSLSKFDTLWLIDENGNKEFLPMFAAPQYYCRWNSVFNIPPAAGWEYFVKNASRFFKAYDMMGKEKDVMGRNNTPEQIAKALGLLFLKRVFIVGNPRIQKAYLGLYAQAQQDPEFFRLVELSMAFRRLPGNVEALDRLVRIKEAQAYRFFLPLALPTEAEPKK